MARGLTPGGLVMEVWASGERTWSIVISRPDGVSCLAIAGEDFEPIIEGLVPRGRGA